MQNQEVDLIIVGQGLAGSILALEAISRNYSIKVIENNHKRTASFAAIGMHNPLIIKRLRKSWRAKEFIENAITFYDKAASILGNQYRKNIDIYRPFSQKSEEDAWIEKMSLEAWKDYIDTKKTSLKTMSESVGLVKMGGWLAVHEFILDTEKHLQAKSLHIQEEFDHGQVDISANSCSYKNIHSKHLVFCEGYQMSKNPFFNYLPMEEVKGEVILIEDKNLNLEHAIKGPFYLVPVGKNRYKAGATFDWKSLDESTTDKAKEQIIEAVRPFLSNGFKVIGQKGGVRPTVKDRRPLVGTHSKYHNLHILNGLGTRGVTLGPYFSSQLLDAIFENKTIDFEANIARFN
ncbi:MAG: FAD-binding oxidoreductase [Bacteroidota bacterium]